MSMLGRVSGVLLVVSVLLFSPRARAEEGTIGTYECNDSTVGQACDDGLECTDSDRCYPGGLCTGFIHCDDGDPCTVDACGEGPDGCDHIYDSFTCGPGELSCPVPIELMPPKEEGELDLRGAGCGCRAGGSTGGPDAGTWMMGALVLGVLAFRRLRRARRLAAVGAGAVLALGGGEARAELPGFDTQIFRPATSSTGFMTQESPDVLPGLGVNLALTMDVADAVLVARDSLTDEMLEHGTVVGRRATMHVGAGLGLGGGFELGADLPVVVDQEGDMTLVRPGATLDRQALGDLRLHAKLRLRGGRLSLAAVATATVPTGSTDDFTGGRASLTESFVAGTRLGPIAIAMNVGYRMRKNRDQGTFTIGDELLAGGALSVELASGLWLMTEAYGAIGVGAESTVGESPAEAVGGVRWRIAGPWVVQAGAGMGLTDGFGTPRVRGVIGIGFAPAALVRPAAPYRPVTVKREPTRSEQVREEQVVSAAGEPEDPAVAGDAQVASVSGELHAAVTSFDTDGDTIPDRVDFCPGAAETFNQILDDDGCPDADRDGDRIADLDDRCPDVAETANGFEDGDGCVDVSPTDERIAIDDVQLFAYDSARLVATPVLAEVVDAWKQHPGLARLVVIGHADERGSAAYNDDLAARRAQRVRAALVGMGIPVERIEVLSEGNRHPRVVGSNERAWQQNRRVEFVLVRGESARD